MSTLACLFVFSACGNVLFQAPLLSKVLLSPRVLRLVARVLVKQTSMETRSEVRGASASITLLIHHYTVQSNSSNCCTGSFASAATCPPSGVMYYSYFSAYVLFNLKIFRFKTCAPQKTIARILTRMLLTNPVVPLSGHATPD